MPVAKMEMDNARHPEQLEKMLALEESGGCHFCAEGFKEHSAAVIHEGNHWFVTANDFPYEGSVHHYLIVNKTHITRLSEIADKARVELFSVIEWLEEYLGVAGASVFVRSGDMAYTGATLDHLHFHFLVGGNKADNPKHLSVVLAFEV